jgi:hypothetical protein
MKVMLVQFRQIEFIKLLDMKKNDMETLHCCSHVCLVPGNGPASMSKQSFLAKTITLFGSSFITSFYSPYFSMNW